MSIKNRLNSLSTQSLIHKTLLQRGWDSFNYLLVSIGCGKDEALGTLGFNCTDPDNGQWVRRLSDDKFEVIENMLFNRIDISTYRKEDLDSQVSSFYSGGLDEVIEFYGGDWKYIVAEIISETKAVYGEDVRDF